MRVAILPTLSPRVETESPIKIFSQIKHIFHERIDCAKLVLNVLVQLLLFFRIIIKIIFYFILYIFVPTYIFVIQFYVLQCCCYFGRSETMCYIYIHITKVIITQAIKLPKKFKKCKICNSQVFTKN